jgi:hypothetical protein
MGLTVKVPCLVERNIVSVTAFVTAFCGDGSFKVRLGDVSSVF